MPIQRFFQVFSANGSWTAPWNLAFPPAVYSQGPGGTGGNANAATSGAGAGAGGLGGEPALGGVAPGTVLTVTVPAAGSATATTITGGSVTVTGNPGTNASSSTAGTGGAASANTVAFKGGSGGGAGSSTRGGGGGGSAGSTSAGGNGTAGTTSTTGVGGSAGTGAAGPPSLAGAAGGNGAASPGTNGNPGGSPGAGGGGACGQGGSGTGGAGKAGFGVIIWSVFTLPPLPMHGPAPVQLARITNRGGTIGAAPPAPTPAPFYPQRTRRGATPVQLARTGGLVGKVTIVAPPTPAPLYPQQKPLRGPPAARPGRMLRPAIGIVIPVIPVIPPGPYISPDILKPWKKRAWPRVGQMGFAARVPIQESPAAPPLPAGGAAGRDELEQAPAGTEHRPGLLEQLGTPAGTLAAGVTKRVARRADTGGLLADPEFIEYMLQVQQKRRKP